MTAAVRRWCVGLLAIVLVLLGTARPASADAVRDRQWHLAALGIAQAQHISQGEGVVVGLPDTGVDIKHAELSGAVLPGKGFGEGNDNDGRADYVGHGTSMAGLIAGRGLPNGGGALGIAPKAMILPMKTLKSDDGLGVPALLAAGIDWAVEHSAKVICIAAVTGEDAAVRSAVERALRADVVVVAGVGNTPDNTTVGFPARLPGVLAVGGSDRDGGHAPISATGPEMMVAAPAVDIVSTRPNGRYAAASGTSDATAIVSGVVALVRAKYPGLSAAEVVHRITATATDKGKPGRDDEFGFGIVNPVAALTADVAPASSSAGVAEVAASPSAAGVSAAGGSSAAVVVAGGVGVVLVLVAVGVWAIRRRARE
ncbi:S8 family serine peptidase [Dactylosporangium sp. NPDC051485]|uniref:S8 family serine peptidase n=1 Tax=Dactylosporangium sp. NPDC051485 TaxID=3154846 RepID=UPI003438FB77